MKPLPFFLLLMILSGASHAAQQLHPHIKVDLVLSHDTANTGSGIYAGIVLAPEVGWHTYWRNAGDSGIPPSVSWTLPEGIIAGPIRWSLPEKIYTPPLVNYGYHGRVIHPVKLLIPPQQKNGRYKLRAKIAWLVCREECIPGSAILETQLGISNKEPAKKSQSFNEIQKFLDAVPKKQANWRFEKVVAADASRLTVFPATGTKGIDAVIYMPHEDDGISSQNHLLAVSADSIQLTLPHSEDALLGSELKGVLRLETSSGTYGVQVPKENSITFANYFLMALLGGLILNFMPCVFPILSIKVLSLIKQRAAGSWLIHHLLYGLGVLVSFWIVVAVLEVLKLTSEGLGWGFHLQSPVFIGVMSSVFFLLGLNLLGLFDFNVLLPQAVSRQQQKTGHLGAFFSGVLAVLVASPCTAPFMGVAVGYGLSGGPLLSLAIFTGLAIGFASPFLILGLFPNLLAVLPRPGKWMVYLKEGLAFPLFLTCIWLLWVLSVQSDTDAILIVLISYVFIGILVWLKRLVPQYSTAYSGSMAIALGAVAIALSQLPDRSSPVEDPGKIWLSYSPTAVNNTVKSRPVFIDFTAAWCVSCQVNKKLVLEKPSTLVAFKANNVALYRADWTNHDPMISAELKKLGRQGVPVYVLYGKDGYNKPLVLPEILTQSILTEALATLKK